MGDKAKETATVLGVKAKETANVIAEKSSEIGVNNIH